MITFTCIDGETQAHSEYKSVEEIINSDNNWRAENEDECEIFAHVVELPGNGGKGIVVKYCHYDFSDGDTVWLLLKHQFHDNEWKRLLDYYNIAR